MPKRAALTPEEVKSLVVLCDKLWEAHGVVVSGGSWLRHIQPVIYDIFKLINLPSTEEEANHA